MKAILMCALLAVAGQLAVAADPPHHSHTVSRSAPGPHHTKPSSFAPEGGHSTTHVYGSPIQAPILQRRTPPRKKPPQAPANASGTQPGK